MKGVEITYLIDPDTRTYAKRTRRQIKTPRWRPTPKTVQDVRKALDDQNLDAISIATPEPLALPDDHLGLPGGQGRLRREAVQPQRPRGPGRRRGRAEVRPDRPARHAEPVRRRSGPSSPRSSSRASTASSSSPAALCYKDRNSIGDQAEHRRRPAELDFNLWLGPAPEQPFHANLVHYNWHWFWDFGNGDIGNQGVHQMDIARWLIPGATLPKTRPQPRRPVRLHRPGRDAQHPDRRHRLRRHPAHLRGPRPQDRRPTSAKMVGNIAHFEAGIDRPGREQGPSVLSQGQADAPAEASRSPRPGPELKRGPGDGHFGNFIAAVRSRKTSDLNADILEGHYSARPLPPRQHLLPPRQACSLPWRGENRGSQDTGNLREDDGKP